MAQIEGGPLYGQDLSKAEATHIMVAEVNGEIQAYWPICMVLHMDGLYFKPEARHRRTIILQLLGQVIVFLQSIGAELVFAVIEPATFGEGNLPMAEKLGLEKVPGDLYFLKIDPAAPAADTTTAAGTGKDTP